MRYKFRGKSKASVAELNENFIKHENGWVYGNLITNNNGRPYIVGDIVESADDYIAHEFWVPVDPETVGQFTGLKDKNGVEIYEGDVVKGHWWEKGNKNRHIGRVVYVMNAFQVRGVKQYLGIDDKVNGTYEVIGNIHDNPELVSEQ